MYLRNLYYLEFTSTCPPSFSILSTPNHLLHFFLLLLQYLLVTRIPAPNFPTAEDLTTHQPYKQTYIFSISLTALLPPLYSSLFTVLSFDRTWTNIAEASSAIPSLNLPLTPSKTFPLS